MKSIGELLVPGSSAWSQIERAVVESGRGRVLPNTRELGERALLATQVTTRSALGAIALESGGLMIDHGWLRILGAGGPQMRTSLVSMNDPPYREAFIVAGDAVGGVFGISHGQSSGTRGNVCYLQPDSLSWLDLKRPYSDFLAWALRGDLAAFYQSLRWSNWRDDIEQLAGDEAVQVLPPPFAALPVGTQRVRKRVPVEQLWRFMIDMSGQVKAKNLHAGSNFTLKIR